MVHTVIYGMRGWIAFVAFIEFSNAIRSFIDETQFLQTSIFPPPEIVSPVMARLFGRYCLLNGVILTHCALFIDHMPVISLSICSLSLSIMLYLSEAVYYYTSLINFYVVFPTLISFSTIVCLFIAPFFIEAEPTRQSLAFYDDEDEDEEDDYEMKAIKRRTNPGRAKYSSGKIKMQ